MNTLPANMSRAWSLANYTVMGLRLLCRLPGYLRHPLTIAEAQAILRQRLERREDDFLDLAQRTIFANRESPYYSLLSHAGCEYGDLERQVRQDGLEGTLRVLFRAGVYLTLDEYKGHRPVVRGGLTLTVNAQRLRNPLTVPQLLAATSGSRGSATQIPFDMACIRDRAVNMYLSLAARGGAHWRNAVWGMPGIVTLLWYSACGGPAARWFTTLDMHLPGLHPRYRWNALIIAWTGRLSGVRVPYAEFAPMDTPLPIIRWMEQMLQAGEVPHLWTSCSLAVSLCRVAEEAGIDLEGAQFTVTGEPVTDSRLAAIRRVGADAAPDYGSADSGGSVSGGCLSPEASDDVHVFSDLNALIQADAPPFPKRALLLTSIRPTVPFVFLNVSMGDCATISERSCGCPMEMLGWRTHLHTIRSYEKLTAGGITFADTDIVRILEELLPRRFGGGPTDYQLVEELADDNQPRLRLLVNPSVGTANATAVSDAFLDALANGSEAEKIMACQLRGSGYLCVVRQAPLTTSSGKILHLWAGPITSSGDAQ